MHLNYCAAILALSLVPSAHLAAAPQGRNAEAARFRGMDQDRDGVITQSEWRGSKQSFDVHDWNQDGVLSGDEVRPGARRQQPWPDDPGDTANPYSQLSDWTPERFRDLDHNGDGRIARDEWHFDAELFRRVDSDGNGVISRREFLGLGGDDDDDRDDRFTNLDVNGDGRIARAEWHGGPRVFTRRDRDGDGFLSRVELLGADEDDAPADLFGSLDVNRDDRVTPNEWHWARAGFDRRDRNRDGSLSRAELAASAQPVPAQRSAAYRAGYERGLLDGRKAGREDRQRNRWDLDGQRELEQADAGYTAAVGQRSEYQAGYREAFTRAYGEGYGPRP
jgi:Ca2+-binding EF-hand superfamily protein